MKVIKYLIRDCIRFILRPKGYTYVRFLKTHKYLPKLKEPQTFSEKLIFRKFIVDPTELSQYVDKYTVRQYVRNLIGDKYLIPLIKSVTHLSVEDFNDLPASFVMKTSNGGGGENVLIVEDKSELDLENLCKQFNAYLKIKVGKIVDEHFYDIETPRVIFEKLIKLNCGGYPSDFKLHIFQGELEDSETVIVQVDADRFSNHKRSLYSEDLQLLNYNIQPKYDSLGSGYEFPGNMEKLIGLAKQLARPFKYVRVDMYNVDGVIYFGELTFCHGSGWEPMSSKSVDELWGSYWHEFNNSIDRIGVALKSIAITANTSWYLYNFRKNTILALLEQGYKVIAIAPIDDYSQKLTDLGATYLPVKIDSGGTNPVNDIATFYAFYKLYKQYKPRVTLNFTPKNNIYSTLAAKCAGVKTLNNIAGLGTLFINESVASKIARVLYKYSQNQADFIFFQNEDDRALFKSHRIAQNVKSDRLPGSGADLSRFIVSPAPDDGVTRFLLIARMLFDKGIGQYVDAARALKKQYGDAVEFRLLGFLDVDNPSAVSKAQMNAWVDEGVVNYLGTSDNVEAEIAQVDCMVLPSYYREGVPKSLLEAGAMGKPIVTTDNVGCRETVDDGFNGFICEPRSAESLTNALSKIIIMPHSERLQLGVNSRIKIENEFDEKIVINKYLAAVSELLTQPKS